jgi:hypothetical protein
MINTFTKLMIAWRHLSASVVFIFIETFAAGKEGAAIHSG